LGGWAIQDRQDGGHELLYLDDTGEEPLIATFGHAVLGEELIKEVLLRAQETDRTIGPDDYGVMLVATPSLGSMARADAGPCARLKGRCRCTRSSAPLPHFSLSRQK
jgi:hypothetical protein